MSLRHRTTCSAVAVLALVVLWPRLSGQPPAVPSGVVMPAVPEVAAPRTSSSEPQAGRRATAATAGRASRRRRVVMAGMLPVDREAPMRSG